MYKKNAKIAKALEAKNAAWDEVEKIKTAMDAVGSIPFSLRREVLNNGTDEEVEALLNKIDQNAEELARLANQLSIAKIRHLILKENYESTLIDDVAAELMEALRPFHGKKYGEKTRAKVREAMHAKGYSVYIGKPYRIGFNILSDQGTTAGQNIEFHVRNGAGGILDDDNRISADFVVSNRFKKATTEEANEKAKKIYNEIAAYKRMEEALIKKGDEISALFPRDLNAIPYISAYSHNL